MCLLYTTSTKEHVHAMPVSLMLCGLCDAVTHMVDTVCTGR